jgi:hypothetical protein
MAVNVLAGTALAFLGGAALLMPGLAGAFLAGAGWGLPASAAVLPGAGVLLGGRETRVVKQKIGIRNYDTAP